MNYLSHLKDSIINFFSFKDPKNKSMHEQHFATKTYRLKADPKHDEYSYPPKSKSGFVTVSTHVDVYDPNEKNKFLDPPGPPKGRETYYCMNLNDTSLPELLSEIERFGYSSEFQFMATATVLKTNAPFEFLRSKIDFNDNHTLFEIEI